MEEQLIERGGRKVHYAHSFYPMELFYGDLYDGNLYAMLREKYNADGAFPHVYEKIITTDGKL
eukprot:764635-Hanusia_phi.AAC.9